MQSMTSFAARCSSRCAAVPRQPACLRPREAVAASVLLRRETDRVREHALGLDQHQLAPPGLGRRTCELLVATGKRAGKRAIERLIRLRHPVELGATFRL